MKTQALHLTSVQPLAFSVKADVAIKVILFAAILTCVNLVAFM